MSKGSQWSSGLVLWVLCVVICTGCSRGAPPLLNASSSSQDLASAVLEALAQRDANRLRALALSEREFRDHVWPELPASRPERNLPFSYVWGDLRQKSEESL